MKFKKLKNKSGFTLIEILVAMSITMLIATAFFMINNVVIKSNSKNERDTESLMIAQSILENVRQGIKDSSSNTIDIQIDINSVMNINRENILDKPENIEGSIDIGETYNVSDNIQVSVYKQNKEYSVKLYMAKITTQEYTKNLYDVVVKVKLKESISPSKEIRLQTHIYEK